MKSTSPSGNSTSLSPTGAANSGAGNRRTVRITSQSGAASDTLTSTIRPGLLNSQLRSNTSAHSAGYSDGAQHDDVSALHQKMLNIEEDLRKRQENFISRERAYKLRIDELEQELTEKRQQKTGWMKEDPKIRKLKEMQGQILSNVALVQDRFSRIMQEQESDLLRAFKARLLDVQAELEMEKSKKDDGAVAFIEKSKSLEYEVERQKEHADVKERQNQALLQANNRLKSQFTSQEEDRNFLMSQLVAAQKDNGRLRSEHIDLSRQTERVKNQIADYRERLVNLGSPVKETLLGTGLDKALGNVQALQQRIDSEERYKEVNQRLRRLLAEERKSLQQVRQNYANELSARTDLEMLLRQCVEKVKTENQHRESEGAVYNRRSSQSGHRKHKGRPGGLSTLDEEEERKDRERVLELLLSRDEVVQLIYTKQYNRTGIAQSNQNGEGTSSKSPFMSASRQQSKKFFEDGTTEAATAAVGAQGAGIVRPATADAVATDKLPQISPHVASNRLVSR